MSFSLRIARIQQECEAVKSFALVAKDGDALPAFTAGAHIDVAVELPCGTKAWRSYSIVSDPADRSEYVIAVLLEQKSSGGSAYMHHNVHVGQLIEVQKPKNHFPLSEDASEHLLIAGGIGITPILCMARTLSAAGTRYSVHYSARAKEAMAFRDFLVSVCGAQITLYFDGGVPANGIDLRGLLSTRRPGQHVYVCGPRGMIDDVRRICAESGWPPEAVHSESFAAIAATGLRQPIDVFLAKSGILRTVSPDMSILDSLIDAGIDVDYDCKRGECGVCTVPVLEGVPLHQDYYLNEREREENKVMQVCVSWAKTRRLVLDL